MHRVRRLHGMLPSLRLFPGLRRSRQRLQSATSNLLSFVRRRWRLGRPVRLASVPDSGPMAARRAGDSPPATMSAWWERASPTETLQHATRIDADAGAWGKTGPFSIASSSDASGTTLAAILQRARQRALETTAGAGEAALPGRAGAQEQHQLPAPGSSLASSTPLDPHTSDLRSPARSVRFAERSGMSSAAAVAGTSGRGFRNAHSPPTVRVSLTAARKPHA